MKKVLALVLAAVMLFALSACGVSSSSTTTTTITTTKTDADGHTTTNTITNEIGVSAGTDGIQTKNETTEEFDEYDEYSADDVWYDTFSEGAEGVNDDGESFYFAYDDPDELTYGMLVMISADGTECHVRNGDIVWYEDTDSSAIYDKELEVLIPFEISDSDEENAFTMTFLADDDAVTMYYVDQDVIIRDIQNVLMNYTFD